MRRYLVQLRKHRPFLIGLETTANWIGKNLQGFLRGFVNFGANKKLIRVVRLVAKVSIKNLWLKTAKTQLEIRDIFSNKKTA